MKDNDIKWYSGKYDRVFKEIFYKEKNKGLLKKLLEHILKIKINNIEIINNEKERGNINIKGMRTDLSLDTDQGHINVEVNSVMKNYVHPRNFSYIADKYSHDTLVGKTYSEKIQYTQINLSYGLMLDDNNKILNNPIETEAIRIYKVQDKEGKEFVKNFTIYEINMDYYLNLCYNNDKELSNEKVLVMLGLDKENLEKLSKKDKMVKEYMKEINTLNENPKFREYISYEEDLRKIQNSLKEEAREEGLKEGLEEGIKEGIKEGINSNKIEIAKNLLSMNMSVDDITKATGLTKEEIEKLK